MREKVYVNFLGNLSASWGKDFCVDDKRVHSLQLEKLFTYIAYNHTRQVPTAELTDAICPESSNPVGTLKNLVYRLRCLFKNADPNADFIVTGNNGYSWNNNYEIIIDTERFENFAVLSRRTQGEEELKLLLSALELYKGNMLPNIAEEMWMLPIVTHYRTLYGTCVERACEILAGIHNFKKMSYVAAEAIKIDPYSEKARYLLIKSLAGRNETCLALNEYKNCQRMLYKNYGVAPSEKLRLLYDEIQNGLNATEHNILSIKKKIGTDFSEGAFFCEYGIFCEIYRLTARQNEQRKSDTYYLVLLTCEVIKSINTVTYLKMLENTMDMLKDFIIIKFRRGDVITRYSGNQFLIILPHTDEKSAKELISQTIHGFSSENPILPIKITYLLNEI